MKNRLTLAIIFLFTSYILFWASESQQQLCLKSNGPKQIVYNELLTQKLKKLFRISSQIACKITWFENSRKMIDLIRQGANPNINGYGSAFLLKHACLLNDNDLIRACVMYGASLEFLDVYGETPVYFAKAEKTLGIFSELGANFNYQCMPGVTALHKAVTRNRSTKVIEFLSRCIMPVYKEHTDTPLHNLCLMSKDATDFGEKMALLLWWLPYQDCLLNDKRQLPHYYLAQENPDHLPLFCTINKEMKKIHEVSPQWRNKQNKNMKNKIQKFIPVGNVADLICSFVGEIDLLPQWRHEGNKKMKGIVKKLLPVSGVTKLVCSFVGEPYLSLRYVMQTQDAKREYPNTAKLFA